MLFPGLEFITLVGLRSHLFLFVEQGLHDAPRHTWESSKNRLRRIQDDVGPGKHTDSAHTETFLVHDVLATRDLRLEDEQEVRRTTLVAKLPHLHRKLKMLRQTWRSILP